MQHLPRYSLLALFILLTLPACAAGPEPQQPVQFSTPRVTPMATPPAPAFAETEETRVCIVDPVIEKEELPVQTVDGLPVEDGNATAEFCDAEEIILSPEEQKALETPLNIEFELDQRECEEVQRYFKYYTHSQRKVFARWLKRSEAYLPHVRKYFMDQDLPQDLVFLPFAESGYNPIAYSRAGAAGMWQFIPGTGKLYGLKVDWWIDERRDPYLSTKSAAAYLRKLHDQFGDWYLALAAYNAGEGKVARAMERSGCDNCFDIASSRRNYLKEGTRLYVPKLLAILKIIQNLESLGFEPLRWDAPEDPTVVEVQGGTDLLALSQSCNMTWDDFKTMNPAFRRMVSPPGRNCPVYLPPGKLEAAQTYLSQPDSRPYAGYQRYQIRRGDSWWRIARRFALPVDVIRQANNTRELQAGAWLMIPTAGHAQALADASEEDYSPSPVAKNHTVKKGETLWKIARRYGVSVPTLQKANRLGGSKTIRAGQVLSIPGGNRLTKTRIFAEKRANYFVRKGDTLSQIAERFHVSTRTLAAANGLGRKGTLKIGQKLYIPDYSEKASRQAKAGAERIRDQIVKYKVRSGDSLWSIARKFGVSTRDLQAWNDISGKGRIHPGDSLKVYVP